MESRSVVIARAMRPLVYRLYDVVRRHSPPTDLTVTQGSVLSLLVNEGPQRMTYLADREGVRLPTMTNVIARLERDGYVRRAADPDDKRAVMVSVTSKARRDLDIVLRTREEFLRERLEKLGKADREAIAAALPALSRLLDD